MSKSKESTVETTEEEAVIAKSSVSKTNETDTTLSDKRMGLTRFLQLEPQKRGIEAVLARKYKLEVMKKSEWEQTVKDVCSRSVR